MLCKHLDIIIFCFQINNGVWQLGDRLCDSWVALDVMGCTASILHLTAISIDRYVPGSNVHITHCSILTTDTLAQKGLGDK